MKRTSRLRLFGLQQLLGVAALGLAATAGGALGAEGVSGPNVAVTPKSVPFAEDFKRRYGNFPSYAGYTAYDEVYYTADAVKRAGSAEADKLVAALETTDWEGTIGRVQFYGKDDPFTHSIKYGKGLITGLILQWQSGRQASGVVGRADVEQGRWRPTRMAAFLFDFPVTSAEFPVSQKQFPV
jgi:hypothetical protein